MPWALLQDMEGELVRPCLVTCCDQRPLRSTLLRSLQRRWQAGRWTGDGFERESGPTASVSSVIDMEATAARETARSGESLFAAVYAIYCCVQRD